MPGHPFRPLSVSSKRRKGAKEQPPVHLIDSIEKDSDEEDTDEKEIHLLLMNMLSSKESLTLKQRTVKLNT